MGCQAARVRQRQACRRPRRTPPHPRYFRPAVLKAGSGAAQRHHRPLSATWSTAVSVAIIDYGSGNLHSAAKAFERAARSMESPSRIVVTRDPETVYRADRIVLPGVGAFADCRRGLDALDGMLEAMTEAVRQKARPFFGIGAGMQLMPGPAKGTAPRGGLN